MTIECRKFVVWADPSLSETYFFCEKKGRDTKGKSFTTRMTTSFSEATIFPVDFSFWEMANDPKFGRFKVYQAPLKHIIKWRLQNKVPSDRL